MTLILPSDEGCQAAALLGEAQAHYDGALEDLMAARRYYKDRDPLPDAETKRVIEGYRRAMQTLFDERKRLAELRRKECGIVADHAIDFDAVRREVEGSLDRLRAAEGEGGIP